MADFNFQQTTAQLQAAINAASRVATSSVDGLMSHTDKNDLTNAKKDIENLQTQVNGLQAIAYVESIYAYGAEFDVTISSRDLTRIGNMDYHRSLPIQNRMRGCLLDDDGNVVEYLDPQSWINHDRSGARGQVMVEIPSGDNVSRVYTTYDPSKFSSSSVTNYAHVGNEARTDGYGKEHIFGETGEIIAKSVGASTTTYLCDYHYQNSDVSSAALRGVRFGGAANVGADAGFACSSSAYAPSFAAASFGFRLCFHPATA